MSNLDRRNLFYGIMTKLHARKVNRKPLGVAEPVRPRSEPDYLASWIGHDYTPEEIEFMMAMDRYKREARRPHPDCRDVLAVAHALGYRKQEAATHVAPDAT